MLSLLPQRSLFFALLLAVAGFCKAAEAPPNIIVLIGDDVGYGDVSCNGGKVLQTPNIDKLAQGGRRFTSGYCSASTCTPTRYSLLTGTYALRAPRTGIAAPNAAAIIRPGTETIASILKRAGYATAAIGKWHLGLGETAPEWNGELKPGPLEIGFDHCLLLPTTNDRVPQVFVEDHRVRNLDPNDPLWVGELKPSGDHPTGVTHRDSLRLDWSHGHSDTIHNGISRIGFYTGGAQARFRDEDLADEWIKEAKSWITQNRDRPFFLYFAAHEIHVPRTPHERFQGKTGLGRRGDAMAELDWCTGELLKSLEELGLSRKTLIIFCSDNGPVLDDGYKDEAVEKLGAHLPSGPYRGGKYSVYEGGTRTPFIAYWPGRIAPAVSDQMVCTIDLPASMAALAQQPIPADACLDSQNVLGALLGEPGAKGRETLLQQDNGGAKLGLRAGHWKLVRQKQGKGAKAAGAQKTGATDELYDLETDPGETTDLASAKPDVLQRMRETMERILAEGRTRSAQ